ncbi:MAG TPA: ATP-grasp domain-containing protein, partial [Limnochordales bacterium]
MRLIEAQAKAVFREAGLKVPEGEVVSRPEQAREVARRLGPVAVKAQIPLGGRGKAGGIRIARTPEEAEQAASALLGSRVRDVVVERLLVEQAVDIQAEFYLSFSLDRSRGQLVGIFSTAGGVDIEEVAETTPERIAKEWVDPCLGLCPFQARRLLQRGGAPPESRRELERFVRTLYELAVSKDAQLVEINPLALTRSGELVALDGKVEVDDNALFRHPE